MDALARELEDLYGARYISFRNALATATGSRESARDAVQEAFARALAVGCFLWTVVRTIRSSGVPW